MFEVQYDEAVVVCGCACQSHTSPTGSLCDCAVVDAHINLVVIGIYESENCCICLAQIVDIAVGGIRAGVEIEHAEEIVRRVVIL